MQQLRSGELIRPFLYGSFIRFPIFFIVAYLFAAPIFGTIIGYFSMIVMTSICFALSSIEIFRGRSHVSTFEKLSSTAKTVLTGSLASWIPHVLNILGIQTWHINNLVHCWSSGGWQILFTYGNFYSCSFHRHGYK